MVLQCSESGFTAPWQGLHYRSRLSEVNKLTIILSLRSPYRGLLKGGYPASVVQAGHQRAQQIDQQSALQTSQRENNDRFPLTLTFHPHREPRNEINHSKNQFKLLQNDPDTGKIFLQPPLVLFKRGIFLVRSVFQTSSELNVVYEKISVAGSHFGTHGHAIDLY